MKIERVAIGISGGELARYSVFYDSLLHLRGVTEDNVIHAKGGSIATNREGIGERAIKLGFQGVLYLDDDQVLPPDTLQKLVAHDKDIVSGLYLSREIPFGPHIYNRITTDGAHYQRRLKPGEKGLIRTLAVGAGCLLVKTDVLRRMERPWWRLGQQANRKDAWYDDFDFCARARQAGFEIWADLNAWVGHQLNLTLWPRQNPDGTWVSALVNQREPIAIWPAVEENPAEASVICVESMP